MKIIICTTPIRPVPTEYPPFGSLAVIQALQRAGYDPIFLDIDGLRPSLAEVIERFRIEAPNLIGISAVVSTAYGFVKQLCASIKQVLPESKIVLGGNLAASAELLHRFCQVDVCVVGEGEKIIVNLANYYKRNPGKGNETELRQIKGLTYLGADGQLVFTGYESAVPGNEFLDPDFSILEQYSNIHNFVTEPFLRGDFSQDPRSRQPHRAGKKASTVVFTKGCVARCTFCHRWDKGFRQIPPEKVIGRIRYLMKRYNVGFIQFGDENFGSDRKATLKLINLIKPLDILWQVAGVRACTLDLDLLRAMYNAGCVALYYGFESGSPDILQVMEKKLELEHNLNAARWTHEANLFTNYQLVLGMPGETHGTIGETIEMLKQITEFLPEPPPKRLSINYIQALPGTPVYEYARVKGLIGSKLEDEDVYLLSISDIEAGDDTKFLNFSEYPYLTVQTWRPRILYETTVHWYRVNGKRGIPPAHACSTAALSYERGGYFNLHDLGQDHRLLQAMFPVRWLFIWIWTLMTVLRRSPQRAFMSHIWELVICHFKPTSVSRDYRTLRHIMRDIAIEPQTQSEKSMMPLRLGR